MTLRENRLVKRKEQMTFREKPAGQKEGTEL